MGMTMSEFKIGDLVYDANWTPDPSENDITLPIGMVITEEGYGHVHVEWLNGVYYQRIQCCYTDEIRHLGGIYE